MQPDMVGIKRDLQYPERLSLQLSPRGASAP